MVQITRDELAEDFSCPHCGTGYVVNWGPAARDSGSARCEACDKIMKTWDDSPIPLFRMKARADNPGREQGQARSISRVPQPLTPKAAG